MREMACNPLYIAVGLMVIFSIISSAAFYLLVIIPIKNWIASFLGRLKINR